MAPFLKWFTVHSLGLSIPVLTCNCCSVDISTSWPTSEPKTFDRSLLPSGPRASTAINIDKSRLPSQPPYTVYLGNLSYECTEEDIIRFFEQKKLVVSYYSL